MTTTQTQTLPITTITFPEIALRTRDAHKLRGYFGELFKEHSPLLHNHLEDGKLRYAYPLAQYKVLDRVPTLVGMGEGATLLAQLFLRIRELDIDGEHFPVLVLAKHIRHEQAPVGPVDDLLTYRFQTLWMALNQENYREHLELDDDGRRQQLQRILRNNILSFLKAADAFRPDMERVLVKLNTRDVTHTQFKNQAMLGFTGSFVTNVQLPDGIGLGKSVSRGFGTIIRER
jgi:hypothetical protein